MPYKAISVFVALLSVLTIAHLIFSVCTGQMDDYTVYGVGHLTSREARQQWLTMGSISIVGFLFAWWLWSQDCD